MLSKQQMADLTAEERFDTKMLGGSIKRGIINPDLLEERQKCNFDQAEMANFFFGTEVVEKVKQIDAFISKHPQLASGIEYYEMTREEKIKHWWSRFRLIMQDEEMHKIITDNSNQKNFNYVWHYLFPGQSPTALHSSMFTKSLMTLGSAEQQAEWLPKADNLNIIGCYAQTELGHGSNVAGLETTATYDPHTQEFVINTPTIRATKFWPGALGVQATHACLYARCISLDNDFGVQPFIVQVRDMETHEPLPGVQVGDVGTKLGYSSVDNGWLSFRQVRVPRSALLCRFMSITPQGEFEMNADPRMIYQIMVATRLQITFGCAYNIWRSAIVAVRYASCRRQFATYKGSKLERKLIDYQTHQDILGSNLAMAVSLQLIARAIEELAQQSIREVAEGSFKSLDILHHFTSGIKAFATEACYDGVDQMRQACGGAGFLLASGIADWWQDLAPFPTFEGVNVIMMQQSSRLLRKQLAKIAKGKQPHPFFDYLVEIETAPKTKSAAKNPDEFLQNDHVLKTLAVRSLAYMKEVFAMISASEANKKVIDNELFANEINRMTRLHLVYLTYRTAMKYLAENSFKDANVKGFLENAVKIFALKQLQADSQSLYECGYFGAGSGRLLDQALGQAIKIMRPQMVPFVETLPEITKYLPTSIGNDYGDIYEQQLETAKASTLNPGHVPDFYHTHIKPVMTMRGPRAKL